MDAFRRRTVLLLTGVPAACAMYRPGPIQLPIAAPSEAPKIRPVALGQQWIYRVRNVYNGEVVDQVTETVVATSPVVRIERKGLGSNPLPDEIQSSWGMIVQEPYWGRPIEFATPVPAWPPELKAGRELEYRTWFRGSADEGFYHYWDQTMRSMEWENVAVSGGRFQALRYDNSINYVSGDFYRIESERADSIWFAPETGRWVLRRNHGQYLVPGRGGAMFEDYLQWELLAWR